MNAQPCLSGVALEVFLIGAMLGCLGAGLICLASRLMLAAARKLRLASLGAKLLSVCAGDMESAEAEIHGMSCQNAAIDDIVRRAAPLAWDDASRGDRPDWRQRRALFGQDCQ